MDGQDQMDIEYKYTSRTTNIQPKGISRVMAVLLSQQDFTQGNPL
jgi:hypothetical protein